MLQNPETKKNTKNQRIQASSRRPRVRILWYAAELLRLRKTGRCKHRIHERHKRTAASGGMRRLVWLYFFHVPFHRPRAGCPQTAAAETPATAYFAPHWNSYLHRRRRAERSGTRLAARMQHVPDLFLQSAAVGTL